MGTHPGESTETDHEWLNLKQAAEAYPAFGERYFRQLVEQRRIPVYKAGGPRSRVILRRSDIEALILAGRRDAVND